jgi:hypothetical protein
MAESPTAPLDPVTAAPVESEFSRRLGELLLWLLLVFLTFSLPKSPTLELDDSWRMGLTYFLQQGFTFGRDVIFTYGPLGFLLGRTFTGELLWAHVVWQLLEAVVAATILLNLSRGLAGTARFFCLAFFVLFGLGYEDALQTFLIVLLGWSIIRQLACEFERVRVVAPGGFLSLLAAIKFTNLMLGAFVVGIVIAFALLRRRFTPAWRLAAVFPGGFLFIWTACGQPIDAIPSYLLNSLDVSSGYQATMGLPTPFAPFWKALAVIALLLGYVAWFFRTQPDRLRSAALMLILGAFLYLNWKHGFVRADGHMLGFFYSVLLITVTFPALFREQAPLRAARFLLVPATALSLWGVHDTLPTIVKYAGNITQEKLVRNLTALFHPHETAQRLRDALAVQRTNAALPQTRAIVGNASLDVLGFEQGVALFNQFNYTPRPVFQSYSAYTPHLAELNAAFYASSKAPEYALFKLQTIDERPLMLDDSHVLRIFPHFYRFILNENGYQLWRRRAVPPPFDQSLPRPLTQHALAPNTDLPLGDYERQPLWLTVDLRPSLLGRARNFLYKPPLVHLRVTDVDGHDELYRLPLMAARAGFALNPLVTDLAEFIESQGGESKRWIRQLRLEIEPSDLRYFADTAAVTFSALTPANIKSEYEQQLVRARYSMFSLIPDEVNAFTAPSPTQIDGKDALVMHAPSVMVFTPPPDARRVTGFFGYVPGAYADDGNTDGGEFRVAYLHNGERRVLFSRLLRPKQEPADQGLQPFDVDLSPLPAGGRLFLEITPGPNDEHSWDWTAWADVKIQ